MPSTVLLHNHNGECLKEWSSDLGPIQIGRAPKNDSQAKRIDSGSFRSNKTAVMSSKHAVIEWRGPDKQPWIADGSFSPSLCLLCHPELIRDESRFD